VLETEVAKPAVEYFKAQGYDVYSEVQALHGRADIVAVKGLEVVVVEAKTRFSFKVLAQATRWTSVASKIYILTPQRRQTKLTSDEWHLMREVMTWKGIGWLTLEYGDRILVQKQAKEQEQAEPELLLKYVVPEQQTGPEAGSKGGGYYTEYRGTCNRIAAYVHEHPGARLIDVVRVVKHHYKTFSSARQALMKCAETGVIHGVRAERNAAGAIVLFVDDHPMRGSVRMSAAIESGLEEMGLAPSSPA
jgi:hypothetical protein